MIDLIKLEEYQELAVNSIQKDAIHYLNENRRTELTLKSPTGSGKTVMATAIMEDIAEEHGNVAFLWSSVGKGELHLQSSNSIQEKTSILTCKQVDQVFLGTPMEHRDVFVVNWEKLNGKNNILVSDGEGYNFFDLLNKTRDEGTKIVLFIDESHFGAGKASNTNRIKSKIKADVIINLSATPADSQIVNHEVTFDDVIKAGIIKKNIRLNDNINLDDPQGETNALIKAAKDKREKLVNLYPNDINPLVLIALPNGKDKKEQVEFLLNKMGINYENGKLAIWLTGKDKKNLEGITKENNEVEFLLFKTAITTGWDCTRAHILVKLRSTKSETFSRQLTGRILRMPERKHYASQDLNYAYIYTDETNIRFEETAFPSTKIKIQKASLRPGVALELEVKRLRKTHKGQIYNDTFNPILIKALDEETLDYDYSEVKTNLLKSQVIELDATSVDTSDKKEVKAGATSVGEIVLNNIKQILKDNGIKATTSFKRVVLSLIRYINQKQGWENVDGKIQGLIILKNISIISTCLEKALLDYFVKLNTDIIDKVYNIQNWSPPEELWFDEDAIPSKWNKYAYNRQYNNINVKPNKDEFDYSESIDDDVNVAWWFKNGDKGGDHFSIPYGDGKNFYPDFIIKYHNGDIKIAETKGGHLKGQEPKKDALEAYGIKHNVLTEWVLDGVIEKSSITPEEIIVIKEEVAEESKKLFITFTDHAMDRHDSRFANVDTREILDIIKSTQDEFWIYREQDSQKGCWGIEIKIGSLNMIIKGAYYEEKNRFVIITLINTLQNKSKCDNTNVIK